MHAGFYVQMYLGFFHNVTLVEQMYCYDLLLSLDGLTCTVMGYAEGKVSHLPML